MRRYSTTTSAPATDPAAPFVALDFETADRGSDSACALALVRVAGVRITDRLLLMIRPPRARFEFTWVHGITWASVRGEPTFAEHWPAIERFIAGASFLAAHNASFDRAVLAGCCGAAGVPAPDHDYRCTVQLARRAWGLRPANLPAVCAHLGIPLVHHDPASDAEACARIVIAAREHGHDLGPPLGARERRRP